MANRDPFWVLLFVSGLIHAGLLLDSAQGQTHLPKIDIAQGKISVELVSPRPKEELLKATEPIPKHEPEPIDEEFHSLPQGAIVEAHPSLRNPAPVYPTIARKHGWEGTVVVRVEVSRWGTVKQIAVLHSSGYAVLDDAAVGAILRWRFVPKMVDGVPVDSWVEVPVEFRMRESE